MSYIIHSDPASMSHKTKMEEEKVGGRIDWERVNASLPSVTNSSDGLIFVKIRALDGRKDGQNLNCLQKQGKRLQNFQFLFWIEQNKPFSYTGQ